MLAIIIVRLVLAAIYTFVWPRKWAKEGDDMKLNFLDDSPNGESQVEMDFVKIPAGGGCESFWYGVTPVTEAQWAEVMGGPGKGSNRPKTEVSLSDAQEFCAKLGNGARLPTEMEQCWTVS